MKPIWYFVGYILSINGLILMIAGIISLYSPQVHQPVLYELHSNIWWGGLMLIVGLIYIFKNKNVIVE